MELPYQILFSLAIAAIAEAILIQTSAEQVQSTPRGIKDVTYSKTEWSNIEISNRDMEH